MGAPVIDCERVCILGKKLIISGALMEAGFASFIQAESEKIEAIVEKYLENEEAIPPTTEEVLQLNENVTDAIEAIRDTEELILQKITLGNQLRQILTDDCPCEEDDNGGVEPTGCC
jgi:hypothetical protein